MSDREQGDQSSTEVATAWPRRTARILLSLVIVVGSVVGVAAAAFLASIAATGCFWSCSQDPDPGGTAVFLAFASVFVALAIMAIVWGATRLRVRTVALRVGLPALSVAAAISTIVVLSI